MVFSALTALSLFRLGQIRKGARRPRLRLAAAVVYAAAVACILAMGLVTLTVDSAAGCGTASRAKAPSCGNH